VFPAETVLVSIETEPSSLRIKIGVVLFSKNCAALVELSFDAPTTTNFVPEIVAEVPMLTLFDASLPIAPEPLGGACVGPTNANASNANVKTAPTIKIPATPPRTLKIAWGDFFFIEKYYFETVGKEEVVAETDGAPATCVAAASCSAVDAAAGLAINCAMLLVLLSRVQKMIC